MFDVQKKSTRGHQVKCVGFDLSNFVFYKLQCDTHYYSGGEFYPLDIGEVSKATSRVLKNSPN